MEMTEKELDDIRYKATEDYELGYENKYSPVYPHGSLYGPETVLGLFDEIDRLEDQLRVSDHTAMSAISRAETAENLLKESVKQLTEITEMVNKWKRDYGSGSQIEIVFGKQVVSVDTVVKSVLKILEGSE